MQRANDINYIVCDIVTKADCNQERDEFLSFLDEYLL